MIPQSLRDSSLINKRAGGLSLKYDFSDKIKYKSFAFMDLIAAGVGGGAGR